MGARGVRKAGGVADDAVDEQTEIEDENDWDLDDDLCEAPLIHLS